jgi:para-nitrobenzyl esterase
MDAVVETSLGTVQGVSEDGFEVYRGIPYARPPVGDLRFRAPEPPEPWSGVRDATRFGPSPLQADIRGGLLEQLMTLEYPEQAEDCLTLNIWTPAADGRRRPVMVWIHGGAFVMMSGSLPMYDGSQLAKSGDVVVVTINYRLGAMGFLHLDTVCGDEIDASGNQGLLDQVAALRWVISEIHAFGGDPTNVTVFGQSAGAISISAMLAMPETTGLFHKAILQSGSANLVRGPENAARTAGLILDDLGLSPDQAQRLRDIPAEDLVAAQDRATPRKSGTFYGPIGDDKHIPADLFAAIGEGSASNVSVMIGTNEDEMTLFMAADPGLADLTENDLLLRVAQLLGNGEEAEERAAAAVDTYRTARQEREENTSPRDLLLAVATDWTFRWPAMRLAELQSKHTPVHTYVFDWPSPAMNGMLGATHLVEVPFVFGTHAHPHLRDFCGRGDEAEHLSLAMQEAWVRFARFGSPSTPALPEWPAYEPGQRWTMRLGRECGAEEHPREPERAFWNQPVGV